MARILITGFCAVPGPTRAGVQLRHVVRGLSPDHNVDLLVVRDVDQGYVERQGTVRVLRVPVPEADLEAQVQAFRRALKRQLEGADYDVVHCRDGWTARTVLDARPTFGYAVVYDLARAPWVDAGATPDLAAAIDRDHDAAIAEADLVLVPTEAARRHALTLAPAERVLLSPPGVDVDRFDWDDGTPGAAAGERPVVLYAGPLEAGRGLRTLLRAFASVLAATPARLRLVGPLAPAFETTLVRAVTSLGLAEHVEVRPAVDHDAMPRLIADAAVCVVPAAPELAPRATALYPTKLLEFMACRRAVVAPRCGSVALVIEHGREGLTFVPRDAEDLARKLVRLVMDAELRSKLAQQGYERVRRDFTASAARRTVRVAYQRLGERPEFRARFEAAHAVESADAAAPTSGRPLGSDDEGDATVFESMPVPGGDGRPGSHDDQFSVTAPVPLVTLGPQPTERYEVEDTDVGAVAGFDGTPEPTQPREAPPVAAAAVPLVGDAWVVRASVSAPRASSRGSAPRASVDEDGTPIDVPAVAAGPMDDPAPTFAAGEIDVPATPGELAEILDGDDGFTAASKLLGPRPPS